MNKFVVCAAVGVLGLSAGTSASEAVSEQDYLGDLPVVLSVSRLAQPIDEAPAAVTVIDRDTIRRSGVRTVAELMRLVPGFLVSYFEGGARPFANYHGGYDSFSRHLQVFIDGRSVYSGLLLGSPTYGLLGLNIDEIERIEVVRGSNAASQGANAVLGAINITTRHAADTTGTAISLAGGSGGIADRVLRYGWGDDKAAFRISTSSRRDSGFRSTYDDKDLSTFNFRADLRPGARDEISLVSGYSGLEWGVESPARDERWRSAYARLNWTRSLDSGSELRAGGFTDQEQYINFYPLFKADGVVRRSGLDLQHVFVPGTDWRMIWGGEYRGEEIHSADLFGPSPDQANRLWRLFGNAEWRASDRWLFNAGALWEHHSIVGSFTAPRLSANFKVIPGQTVRIATTSAFKVPNQFESRAVYGPIRATGGAYPERVDTTEIGYIGEFRNLGLTVDFRGFEEKVRSVLRFSGTDIANKDPNTQHGWESQFRWQPSKDTSLLFNYTALRIKSDPGSDRFYPQRVPSHFATLAWFQRLPWDLDLSVIHTDYGQYFWVRPADMIPAYQQTDIRLAKSFRWGAQKGEIAINVLAANGGHIEYQRNITLDRRAFATLKLEF